MPFNGRVRMTLKSSPRGFEMGIALRRASSSGSSRRSNTLGLSKEYVMLWEKPQNSAISLAISSIRILKESFPVVASPEGRVVGIRS